jgi:hypothetical protein
MTETGLLVHWWDVGAVGLWAAVLVLAVADSLDGRIGVEGFWALLLAPLAAVCTLFAVQRREAAQEYARGLSAGLETAGIVKLPAHR